MKLKNFNKFVNESNNNVSLLTEGILELKSQCWSSLDIDKVFKVLAFSPDWNIGLKQCNLNLKFDIFKNLTEEQKKNISPENIITYFNVITAILHEYINSKLNNNTTIKINKKIIDTDTNIDLFNLLDVCPAVPYIIIQHNNNKETRTTLQQFKRYAETFKPFLNDPETKSVIDKMTMTKTGLKIPCMFKNNKNINKISDDILQKIFQIYKAFEDKTFLNDCKNEEDVNNKITELYNGEIPEDIKAELNNYIQINVGSIQLDIDGYFDQVRYLYILFKYFENNLSILDVIDNDDVISFNNINKYFAQMYDGKINNSVYTLLCSKPDIITQLEIPGVNKKFNDEFQNFYNEIKLPASITDMQKQTLKLANNLYTPLTDADKKKIQSAIDFDNNKLKDDNLTDKEKLVYLNDIKKQQLYLNKKQLDDNTFIPYLKEIGLGYTISQYRNTRDDQINNIIKNNQEKISKDVETELKKYIDKLGDKKLSDDEKNKVKKTIQNQILNDLLKTNNVPPPLAEIKSIIDLNICVENMRSVAEIELEKALNVEYPNVSLNPRAARRMKLFEKVQKLAGDRKAVFFSKNWVVSITQSMPEQLVFGRNRPKVDKNGNIIESTNMDDTEIGPNGEIIKITEQDKMIRDGTGPCVPDNIVTPASKQTETGWCTARAYGVSATSNKWNLTTGGNVSYYLRGLDKGLMQIMDCRNGDLYQVGSNGTRGYAYMLDANDTPNTGLFKEKSVQQAEGTDILMKIRNVYPELDQLILSTKIDQYIYGKNAVKTTTSGNIKNQLIKDNKITSNGGLIISDINDLLFAMPIIKSFSEIILKPKPNNFNMGKLFTYIVDKTPVRYPVFNLQYIVDATCLFEGICVEDTLELKNTNNIKIGTAMFKNARIGNRIIGIDTVNMINTDFMFENARHSHYKLIHIPTLNLKKCISMNYMFKDSGVASINLQNIDNVESAIDAFINCFMISSMPNIKFDKINNIKKLISDPAAGDGYITEENINLVFEGCPKLHISAKYDENVSDVVNYYSEKDNFINTDDRNFLILNNTDDAIKYKKNMIKYDGVVISKTADSIRLFENCDFNIKVLDFNGRTDISNMFYNCNFKQIRKIIGTENIEFGEAAFEKCKFMQFPKISLPKFKQKLTLFKNMYSPVSNPNISYGKYIVPFDGYTLADIPTDTAAYQHFYNTVNEKMLGNTSYIWCNTHGSENVFKNMYRHCFENVKSIVINNLQLELINDGIETDDNGKYYIILNDMADIEYYLSMQQKDVEKIFKEKEYAKIDIQYKDKSEEERDALKNKIKIQIDGIKLSDNFVKQTEFISFTEVIHKNNIKNFPNIDLNGLKNATLLFANVKLSTIGKITGTQNLENCDKMFAYSKIDHISTFNVSNVKTAHEMFTGADFKTIDGTFKFENLEDAASMFKGSLFSDTILNTNFNFAGSNIINAESMYESTILKNIGKNIIENVLLKMKFGNYIFNKCSNITNIDTLIDFNDKLEQIDYGFAECKNLKYVAGFKSNSITSCTRMFLGCENLESIGHIEINSKVRVDMQNMFEQCENLKYILTFIISPNFNTSLLFTNCPLAYIYGDNAQYLKAMLSAK